MQRTKDYIANQKPDGYRGIHLVYRFVGNSQSKPFDKLRIEIQIRTRLQHSWATSVETVDTFTHEKLKVGKGSNEWRRFFQLVGSAHAIMENQPLVPNTPTDKSKLKDEIIVLENKLQVVSNLTYWSRITRHMEGIKTGQDFWYITEILPDTKVIKISSFPAEKRKEAHEKYIGIEKEYEGSANNVALVSVRSFKNLQKAYPNYFADTQSFLSSITTFLG